MSMGGAKQLDHWELLFVCQKLGNPWWQDQHFYQNWWPCYQKFFGSHFNVISLSYLMILILPDPALPYLHQIRNGMLVQFHDHGGLSTSPKFWMGYSLFYPNKGRECPCRSASRALKFENHLGVRFLFEKGLQLCTKNRGWGIGSMLPQEI